MDSLVHERVAAGPAVYVAPEGSPADRYCYDVRTAALSAARLQDWAVRDGGAVVVIDGPRFSTRAESRFFAAQGWLLVNMTGHPEAELCRELGLCYPPVALITDLDAVLRQGAGVRVQEVLPVPSTGSAASCSGPSCSEAWTCCCGTECPTCANP